MTKLFVGIDPSLTCTGVVTHACADPQVERRTTFVEVKCSDLPKTLVNREYKRLDVMRQRVLDTIRAESSSLTCSGIYVCYEGYSYESVNKSFTTGELGGILKAGICTITDNLIVVPPKTIKSFAVGPGGGNADKQRMLEAFEEEHPGTAAKFKMGSDVIDAYYMMKFAKYYYAPDDAVAHDQGSSLTRHRLEVVHGYRKSRTK